MQVPASVSEACRRLEHEFGQAFEPRRESGNRERWTGHGDSLIAYLAYDATTHRQAEQERARLGWAASHGVYVPRVVPSTSGDLVCERVRNDGVRSVEALHLALDQAERITSIDEAPPGPLSSRVRASSRMEAVRYQWQLFRGGVDVRSLGRLRRAVESMPHDTLSHGDFLPNHLLFDATDRRVRVIDWETVSWQPRFSDPLRLWPVLTDDALRSALLDRVLSQAADKAALGLLHAYLAMRGHARCVVRGGAPELVHLARGLVDEARRNAAAWRG